MNKAIYRIITAFHSLFSKPKKRVRVLPMAKKFFTLIFSKLSYKYWKKNTQKCVHEVCLPDKTHHFRLGFKPERTKYSQ